MTANNEVPVNTITFSGLREYYHLNSLIVWNMHCEFEEHLDAKANRILKEYQEDNPKQLEVWSSELHYIQVQMRTQLRYALLPRFLSLFEGVLKSICKISDPISYEKVRQQGWLKTHKKFLKDQDVELDDAIEDFATMRHLITIRDCITHANGEINRCKNPVPVKEAIESIGTAGVFEKDGVIFLGDQVIPTTSIAMSNIFVKLFSHFEHPLDWARWS
ncbi:MAG: hypothetical protein GXP24_09955 [Planctomycetes bacterium]|nr:hypothetical protein [Planctomycetota bacterium]